LAIKGTPNVSGAFEDLAKLFKVLVHVFLFNGVMSFLLGGDIFCAGTTKLNKFDACSAQGVRPFTRAFSLGYTARDFVEQIRRGNRADERGEYVSGKSVESPCEKEDVFRFPLKVGIICRVII